MVQSENLAVQGVKFDLLVMEPDFGWISQTLTRRMFSCSATFHLDAQPDDIVTNFDLWLPCHSSGGLEAGGLTTFVKGTKRLK